VLAGRESCAAPAEDDFALIDAVAAAGATEEFRCLHEDPRPAVPREILSLSPFLGPRTVTPARR
jgi:hypothetical protein